MKNSFRRSPACKTRTKYARIGELKAQIIADAVTSSPEAFEVGFANFLSRQTKHCIIISWCFAKHPVQDMAGTRPFFRAPANSTGNWCMIYHMSDDGKVYADARDPGLSFILPSLDPHKGGVVRDPTEGHFGAIVGRGGAGKSILALQIVTELLENAGRRQSTGRNEFSPPPAAFYFTLEAHPRELRGQVEQFTWGQRRYAGKWDPKKGSRVAGEDEYSEGLYLISIPSPAESLNALNLKIRQTIAAQLKGIGSLEAIVIDPLGAVNVGDELRANLIQLKELAETHRTFVFLLTEKYTFEKYTFIEHYSQSIIHLEHDPGQQQHRRLYVQKARGQSFRSGYHYFELQPPQAEAGNSKGVSGLSRGIRVFPSIAAQSAYAHEVSFKNPSGSRMPFFPDESKKRFLNTGEQIEPGSAVFLMGPPGTFKEHVASEFARAAAESGGATIYLSFKADFEAIKGARKAGTRGRKSNPEPERIDSRSERPERLVPTTYFFDARSPLLTPEEILFMVRTFITPPPPPEHTNKTSVAQDQPVAFQRAVIWGLRRLYDFPNFGEGRVIQFLEALVMLLRSQQITTLVVDWPDQQSTSKGTVPVVDLCQYIFLTRVCYSKESPREVNATRDRLIEEIWADRPKKVALLRAQRTRQGVHHDEGAIFKQVKQNDTWTINRLSALDVINDDKRDFEHIWLNAGVKWEEDLSLLS